MANFNKVIIVGHLTRDPETRHTQSGTAVANLGIAVNHRYKDKDEVCFVDVTAWGRLAEIVEQYMRKGSAVLVEGRLKLDQWETDGQRRDRKSVV